MEDEVGGEQRRLRLSVVLSVIALIVVTFLITAYIVSWYVLEHTGWVIH